LAAKRKGGKGGVSILVVRSCLLHFGSRFFCYTTIPDERKKARSLAATPRANELQQNNARRKREKEKRKKSRREKKKLEKQANL
jgi:hypothetical protein